MTTRTSLTVEQEQHLSSVIANQRTPMTLAYMLMIDAGLRISETLALEWRQLWFGDQTVSAVAIEAPQAKNHRARTIPTTTRLRCEIDRTHKWATRYRLDQPDMTTITNINTRAAYTARQVQRWLKDLAYHTIGLRISPHVLRHTFADRLRKITDIRVVQVALGHADIRTTQIYTHPSQSELADAIAQI